LKDLKTVPFHFFRNCSRPPFVVNDVIERGFEGRSTTRNDERVMTDESAPGTLATAVVTMVTAQRVSITAGQGGLFEMKARM